LGQVALVETRKEGTVERRLAVIVLVGLSMVGSGCRRVEFDSDPSPVESDSAPSAPGPSEGRVEPPLERVEKPEGVELAAIEFAIDEVELTMQAPKGAVLDDSALVLIYAGTHFGLEIGAGPGGLGVKDVKRWVSDDDWFSEKRYLVLGEDAVLVELRHHDEIEYRMAAKKTVGHVDYYFMPILGLGNQPFSYSPDDYRLMLYCASTLARKHPLPDGPDAVLEECGARLRRDDQGHVIEVEVP
jgi:hypothetical protein